MTEYRSERPIQNTYRVFLFIQDGVVLDSRALRSEESVDEAVERYGWHVGEGVRVVLATATPVKEIRMG